MLIHFGLWLMAVGLAILVHQLCKIVSLYGIIGIRLAEESL